MGKIKTAAIFIILCILVSGMICGTAFATWIYDDVVYDDDTTIGFVVPEWDFVVDSDFAKVDYIRNDSVNYFEFSQEIENTIGSVEAIRFTNTAGTTGCAHSFIIDLDRDYTVGEIRFQKVSFDYYFAEKRSLDKLGRGFPKVELVNGTSKVGNIIGGDDKTAVPELAAYSAVDLGNGWWHLEYFISAMTPTYVDTRYDKLPYDLDRVITGIRITDSYIYNYSGNTAYVILDNLQISSAPCIKLGLFNGTTSFAAGKQYWVKVAFAGVINSVNITFDDDNVAEYMPTESSPFYIKGKNPGSTTYTVTMDLGDEHQILTISRLITVT